MIISLAPVARNLGLVDAPTSRKRHEGDVPLIGGIAIFLALALVATFWGDSNKTLITVNGNDALWVFMGCGAFLVLTGSLDDRFKLGIFVRVLSEVLVAIAVIELLDLQVAYLGDLVGSGLLRMDPTLAYPHGHLYFRSDKCFQYARWNGRSACGACDTHIVAISSVYCHPTRVR